MELDIVSNVVFSYNVVLFSEGDKYGVCVLLSMDRISSACPVGKESAGVSRMQVHSIESNS